MSIQELCLSIIENDLWKVNKLKEELDNYERRKRTTNDQRLSGFNRHQTTYRKKQR